MIDAQTAIAVGDSGTIIQSGDGGLTWTALLSGTTNPLYAITSAGANRGFAVGEGGTILGPSPGTVTSVQKEGHSHMLPREVALAQNYPNPFNPTTAISYQLIAISFVTLKVFDLLGREVATLVDGRMEAGTHTAVWNASGFASGVYFYRLSLRPLADGAWVEAVETKAMMVVK
jgi:hypothetical protein